ncbi:MAG: hypothetical protein DYG94_06430 [Leptolyngbya sp. PLA3]|nr:MAG: hypothetical protein EDM82_05710 [Cyanobacteria bacterium CYA]MCE7968366.1 hypothetical protein [Leptolyngbya sp. PL-A3]
MSQAATPRKDEPGLRCPVCGCGHWRVIYTRRRSGGRLVRRRECRHCGKTVTTTEKLNGR